MDELLVTLKMVDIEYSTYGGTFKLRGPIKNYEYNGITIKLRDSTKEVILTIANYLEINKFDWTYILNGFLFLRKELEHKYNNKVTEIELY